LFKYFYRKAFEITIFVSIQKKKLQNKPIMAKFPGFCNILLNLLAILFFDKSLA